MVVGWAVPTGAEVRTAAEVRTEAEAEAAAGWSSFTPRGVGYQDPSRLANPRRPHPAQPILTTRVPPANLSCQAWRATVSLLMPTAIMITAIIIPSQPTIQPMIGTMYAS